MSEAHHARHLYRSAHRLVEKKGSDSGEISITKAVGAVAVVSMLGVGLYRFVIKLKDDKAAKHLNLKDDIRQVTLDVSPRGIRYDPSEPHTTERSTPMDLEDQVSRAADRAASQPVDRQPGN